MHMLPSLNHWFPCSNTAVDYAALNDHKECVQVLRERGGVAINIIKEEAAIHIQSVYRGYRSVNTLIPSLYIHIVLVL